MQSDATTHIAVATYIAFVGAFVGLIGGAVALFNSWKAVCWKRAELANTYMKDFNNSPELVFASRCLDWNGGKLVIPDSLQAYMPNGEKLITHDRAIFIKALSPRLKVTDMENEPRIQIYRVSMDSFLTWMSLAASALDRKLFYVEDLQDIGYWVAKLESEIAVQPFIKAYGYQSSIEKLASFYRNKKTVYKYWFFPVNLTGWSKKM